MLEVCFEELQELFIQGSSTSKHKLEATAHYLKLHHIQCLRFSLSRLLVCKLFQMFQTIICASRRKSTKENDFLLFLILDKITIVISIFLPNHIICKHHLLTANVQPFEFS